MGWIWSQGTLSASPHRVAVLAKSPRIETVHGLRSFIGAYKILGRVLPKCSQLIAPLDTAIAGLQSQDRVPWTDELFKHFSNAQEALTSHKSITLPQPSDQLWIVTDGSVSKRGWSGGAMVLGKLPVPGRPTILITVGQGPTALAVGAGGGCLDIFTLIYPFFPLSPSLWETARYRLKYCLKGPLNPKPTNQQYLNMVLVRPCMFLVTTNCYPLASLAQSYANTRLPGCLVK